MGNTKARVMIVSSRLLKEVDKEGLLAGDRCLKSWLWVQARDRCVVLRFPRAISIDSQPLLMPLQEACW